MNSELIGYGVGICFAAVIVFFIILLTKDSEFFKSMFSRKNKEKERLDKEQNKKPNEMAQKIQKMVNQNSALKIAKSAKIYYKHPGEKSYTIVDVNKVPFVIGGPGFKADLELKDDSVAPKHAQISIRNEEGELYYVFKNLCKTLSNTEYLEQSGRKPTWMYMPEKDSVVLKEKREAFYVGGVKILVEANLMNHQISKSDNELLNVVKNRESEKMENEPADTGVENGYEKEEEVKYGRTSSVRTFEKDVLDDDDVIC